MARETIRIEGLEGVLATLRQLPPEIVSKNGGPVRAALRKAGTVLQKEIALQLQRVVLEPNADGLPSDSTGLLQKNIVIRRGKYNAAVKGERFLVRIGKKDYPGSKDKNGKPVTTPQVARLLEYGTEKMTPKPFIRPAFEAKKEQAVATFTTEINKRLAAIVRKLERQNRVSG